MLKKRKAMFVRPSVGTRKKFPAVLGADDKSRTKATCFDDVQYEVKCWCGVGRVTGIGREDGCGVFNRV